MNLAQISLKRPVMATVMSLAIVLFGIIGYRFLGVRDYPAIDPPNISVSTSYAGANSDIIESQITEPLEKAINGIAGVKNITSSSSQGRSNINVEFELGVDLETAANDVRDKVSRALRQLPQDIDAPPVVSKADASAQPIIAMTVQSMKRNQLEVTEYATNNLVERLQTIPGVSSVDIWGEKRYAMRLWFDPEKLNAYGITSDDIQKALGSQSVELPSGKLTGSTMELTIRTFGRLYTEEDFNNLIIKNVKGVNIRLKDVGEAVLGPENIESVLKESGIPMIMLAVIPLPGANYVAISNEFNKRLDQLKRELPPDFKLNVGMDQTIFIKRAISEVEETLFIAIGLVILIIFVFFRDWIIAVRPLLDIPVSLIGAFFIMYLFGFSINVLTLLAIVLATGLVVDDGIVVTENIFKKIEQGMDKDRAAEEGTKEIYFAVIATSLTLAIVFLPIVFLEGFVGRLFREFGIVVAGAVLISAFVSLTLTPVLNVKLIRKNMGHTKLYMKTEPFFAAMENGYKKSLAAFMKVKWVALGIIAVCLSLMFFIYKGLPSELAPIEDRSQFRMNVTAPEGTNFEYMDAYMDSLNNFIIDSVPEKSVLISVTAPGYGGGSVNSGFIRAMLTDPKDRTRSQHEIVEMLNRNLSKFNQGRAFTMEEQTISVSRRGGQPVQFVIQNNNFEKIREVLPKFLDEAKASKVLQGVDADLKFNKPELRVTVNRLKASELGVSVADINQALELAYSDRRLGYFYRAGKQYSVLGQVDRINREEPADLSKIMVRNNQGNMITLDNLVSLNEASSPPTIYHFNRYKSATISAGLQPGYTVGDGIAEMDRIAKPLLDDSFNTSLAGTSRDYSESSGNTMFAFILALVLIYLVLAAQFESFIDPFIIMVTVPLALAGALLSLWIFGQTFNIFSQIGMIMLIGLVTKNGILIVEFANQLREKGMAKRQAIVEASYLRLRPILMTSLAMSLGALPLALSLGEASTSRVPLGIVIVGGVMFSLILTLYVVPAMYGFLSSKKRKVHEAV
ncbi:MAG: efflux RND transporter permease subunit [Chitinophagaceae bacterium]|nr:efflux RND transporter permease subunit [Chitinophagaceae bacterium]